MALNYNIPSSLKKGSDCCYAIKRRCRVYFTLISPWERGFYQVCDPKLFLSLSGAQKFIDENNLTDCKVVSGTFDPSRGFVEV